MQRHRGGGEGVIDRDRRRAFGIEIFEVSTRRAGNAHRGNAAICVNIVALGRLHSRRAGCGTVCKVDDHTVAQRHRKRALRWVIQACRVDEGFILQRRHVVQRHRGGVAVVHHVGAQADTVKAEARKAAIGHWINAGHSRNDACRSLHVVVIRAACHGQVTVQGAAGNRHCLLNTTHGDVELQIVYGRMVNAETEGNGIAFNDIANNQAALSIDLINGDGGGFERHGMILRGRCCISGRIGDRYRRVYVLVCHQISCDYRNAVNQVARRAGYQPSDFMTVNLQGHRVANLGVATDRAGNGSVVLACFAGVDDVITNRVDRNRCNRLRIHRQNNRIRGGGRYAAGCIAGGNADIDAGVGQQVCRVDRHAEHKPGFALRHGGGIGGAVGGQRHRVAHLDVSPDRAGNGRHQFGGLGGVYDVVAQNRIDGDGGRNGFCRCRTG